MQELSAMVQKSFMLITYKIPKEGTGFEVEIRVVWNEKEPAKTWR